MSWKDLPGRVKADREHFELSVHPSNGAVHIYFPTGHKFCDASHIHVQVGEEEDIGLLRFSAADHGRKVQSVGGEKSLARQYFVRLTLPGAPKELDLTKIESKTEDDGSVILTLPWYGE